MCSTTNVIFNEIPIRVVFPLLEEYFKQHWIECGQVNGPDKLEIDYELYGRMEDIGHYKGFFAQDSEGNLIGYVSTVLATGMHHKNDLYAETDCFYLDPKYRSKGIGYQLIQYAERTLKDKYGVGFLRITVNANKKDIVPLIEKMGFAECDIVYQKKLE